VPDPPAKLSLHLATSNPGKLAEIRAMAAAFELANAGTDLALLPNFSQLPAFDEIHPTFAENATGKAVHYSRLAPEKLIIADDSGLIVPALNGAPGVHSARYAGPIATDADRVNKLIGAMQDRTGEDRRAHFICVIAAARNGTARAVISAQADGVLLEAVRGGQGFGYDPIFFFPPLRKTFAELSREEKNQHSHRGIAFRRLLAALSAQL
jgi:XTP/dITP diphosphohydrolase